MRASTYLFHDEGKTRTSKRRIQGQTFLLFVLLFFVGSIVVFDEFGLHVYDFRGKSSSKTSQYDVRNLSKYRELPMLLNISQAHVILERDHCKRFSIKSF